MVMQDLAQAHERPLIVLGFVVGRSPARTGADSVIGTVSTPQGGLPRTSWSVSSARSTSPLHKELTRNSPPIATMSLPYRRPSYMHKGEQ